MNFVAFVPTEEVQADEESVTMDGKSLLLADPEDASNPPVHFTFNQIISNISETEQHCVKGTPYLYITLFTNEHPYQINDLLQHFAQIVSNYIKQNRIINLTISISQIINEEVKEITKLNRLTAKDLLMNPIQKLQSLFKNIDFVDGNTIVSIASDPQFNWIIVPYKFEDFQTSQKSPAVFIKDIHDHLNKSATYTFLKQIYTKQPVYVFYRFKARGNYKSNKKLLNLSEPIKDMFKSFDKTPEPESTPAPTTPVKSSFASPRRMETPTKTPVTSATTPKTPTTQENYESVYVDNPWNWRLFVSIKNAKGKPTKKIDKERLYYVAQRAVCAVNVTLKDLQDISAELDKQIKLSQTFRRKAESETTDKTNTLKMTQKEVDRLKQEHDAVRRKYLSLRTKNIDINTFQTDETIAYTDDYSFTKDCLKLEIAKVQAEIEFLKTALNYNEEEEDEDQ